MVSPFHLGGMGDLESRGPSSGGGLFTFGHAAQQGGGAADRGEYRKAAGILLETKQKRLQELKKTCELHA